MLTPFQISMSKDAAQLVEKVLEGRLEIYQSALNLCEAKDRNLLRASNALDMEDPVYDLIENADSYEEIAIKTDLLREALNSIRTSLGK